MNLPLQFFFLLLVGWVNRHQDDVIASLKEEKRALQERQGGKRILLNDDQRRRLAVKGKALGRKRLGALGSLVTPDMILGWTRRLIAKKFDGSKRLCQAFRALHPPRVPESHDSPQRKPPPLGPQGVPGSLPQRAASPGPARPPDRPRIHGRRDARTRCVSLTPRRNATTLQPSSCLKEGWLPSSFTRSPTGHPRV